MNEDQNLTPSEPSNAEASNPEPLTPALTPSPAQSQSMNPQSATRNPQSPSPTPPPPPLTHDQAVAMTLLGVDWGRRRIGLAIKPAGQDWSLPQATLHTPSEKIALEGLRQAVERAGANGVVVGLPLHPNPEQTREIRHFTRKVREGLRGVRWFFVDEAFTSQAADDLNREDPNRGRRPTDDLAATLILNTFLQQCR